MGVIFEGPVIVPVADPEDGGRTAAALAPQIDSSSRVIAVHVVEKAGGAPDKASIDHREAYAEEIFENVRAQLEPTGAVVETDLRFGTDVVQSIFDAAVDRDAAGVAFVPREGNRLAELLTGDVARRLVKEAEVPVVALPAVHER